MNPVTAVFLLIILCISAYQSGAQNLVPNPGFETLELEPRCYTSGSKSDFDDLVKDWYLPNEGTSDLLSTDLDPSCMVALPHSTAPSVSYFPGTNQAPRTGKNVAGLKPLSDTRREYLEVKLTCDLVPGEDYYCEMYVSLAEGTNYAQSDLGMYFSNTSVYVNSYDMLSFTPQIVEHAVINDSINWVKISGTFTATGTQRYLLIGCFVPQSAMQIEFLGHKGDFDASYYLIDDVLVKPVKVPELAITGDTVLCAGERLTLTASGWQNIQWLNASAVLASGPALDIVPASSFNLTIKGSTCSIPHQRIIPVTVFSLPVTDIGKDTMICSGTSITLDAGAGHTSYLWQDGSQLQTLDVSVPGKYRVQVADANGCHAADSMMLEYYKDPVVYMGDDFKTCYPQGVLYTGTNQVYDVYVWQDNSAGGFFAYSTEGTYWVTVTNICGISDRDTINIDKVTLHVPNLVTANEDDINDAFEVEGSEAGKGKYTVYNTFGACVYTSEEYRNTWPSPQVPEGVYFFSYEYPTCDVIRGWVQVIR